ncbi:hypothetical protein AB4379_12180 [Vibrio breoganii]
MMDVLETNSPVSDIEVTEPVSFALEVDTNDFDIFSQLDDIKVEALQEVETEEDFGQFEDETLTDENGFELGEVEGIEDEIAEYRDNALAGEIEENLNHFETIASRVDEMPDDMVFNFGGTEVSKAELKGLAQTKEQVKAQQQLITNFQSEFMNTGKQLEAILYSARTETAKDMANVQAVLNNPATDPLTLRQAMTEMQQLQVRQAHISQDTQKFMQQREIQLQQVKQQKLALVSQELDKRYSQDEVGSMVDYAESQGITKDVLFENADVGIMEALMKAKKYDQLLNKSKDNVKAGVKRKATPKATARKEQKPQANKDKLVQAWESGQTNGQNLDSDIFGMLED